MIIIIILIIIIIIGNILIFNGARKGFTGGGVGSPLMYGSANGRYKYF
jgi:hypothetical protein